MTTTTTTYLITGANRGVGRGLADTVLSRENHHLIALVRDPSNETSQSLQTQPRSPTSKVTLLKYDASDPDSAFELAKTLRSALHNISSIDVVIANAGSMGATGITPEAQSADFTSLITANTVAPVILFNALYPDFLKSNPTPAKFIAISSAIGSTGRIATARAASALPYGMSKAAMNHAFCKLNKVYTDVVFGLLTPGPTRTGFGGEKTDWDKIPGAMSLDVVVPGLMERIDELGVNGAGSTGENNGKDEGGNLVLRDWKGDVFPW